MNEEKKPLTLAQALGIAAVGVGAIYSAKQLYRALTTKKVLVSFDWDHDKHYRQLLAAWSANEKFDIEFEDVTPEEIQSNDVGRIKAAITQCIREATHSLVIIGPNANTRHPKSREIGHLNWICFETAQSKALGKKLVVVKVEKSLTAPDEVMNSGAKWALSFNFEAIKKAIDEA
jgi:hypothetical protein